MIQYLLYEILTFFEIPGQGRNLKLVHDSVSFKTGLESQYFPFSSFFSNTQSPFPGS